MDDKINVALERIRIASELSLAHYKRPMIVLYSGGKDSEVLLHLTKLAGVPFEAMHNHTTVDAPETVRHIRATFRALELDGVTATISMPKLSMWRLIEKRQVPPTRVMRYCCAELKETGGSKRHLLSGVRWAESAKRKTTRGIFEGVHRDKDKRIILQNDNDDRRLLTERCVKQSKTITNPIIDWTDQEIWDFTHSEKLCVNPLYECGYSRIGCIGCPQSGRKGMERGFERYPKYRDVYLNAFRLMIDARLRSGKTCDAPYDWSTPEAVMHWWLQY